MGSVQSLGSADAKMHSLRWLKANFFIFFSLQAAVAMYSTSVLAFRGIDPESIGQIRAMFACVSIVSPTACSSVISYLPYYRIAIIRVGIFSSGIFILLFMYSTSYQGLSLGLSGFFFLFNGMGAQYESLVIETLGTAFYPQVRMWGCIGFIFGVLLTGRLVDLTTPETACYVMLSFHSITSFLSLTLPHVHNQTVSLLKNGNQRASSVLIFDVMRDKNFILYSLTVLLLAICLGSFNGFFILYLTGLGYSDSQASFAISIGVFSEVIMFSKAEAVFQQYSPRAIGVCCMLLTALRWKLMALFVPRHFLFALIAQTLHAFSFSLMHVLSIRFFSAHFRGPLAGHGLAILQGLASGFGGLLGALFAGRLWGDSPGHVWEAASLLALAGAATVALVDFAQLDQKKPIHEASDRFTNV
jgi:PPP family 3-phenylpropionic acid transporter